MVGKHPRNLIVYSQLKIIRLGYCLHSNDPKSAVFVVIVALTQCPTSNNTYTKFFA